MKLKIITLFTIVISLITSCKTTKYVAENPQIIPAPTSEIIKKEVFLLSPKVAVTYADDFKEVAQYLSAYLADNFHTSYGQQTPKAKHKIEFLVDKNIENSEGYNLKITTKGITISAATAKGAFYAVQSLKQLLPVSFENHTFKSKKVAVRCLEINDAPQFKYRGMHLDVSRHFFPVSYIKKYIDYLAMLKMNTFHWHLTDDQGWRIEIKKYPKLQEIAAYRNQTLMGHYSDKPHQFDGQKYGGYYTQKEVKEIVKYAQDRQITIIPEIEMPGHSQAAIAAYPALGCTGKPVNVATKWGVFDNIYCPKDETFTFLENVLNEVMELFPSQYIHIGGDEAPKTNWKKCNFCQQLIKKEGLKDEHELQSYFIRRIEKYLNSKGRKIIGWDEILEGGLAPNATVMSWRGTEGAISAAQQKHNVILTPNSNCYFDHYQSTNANEPIAIGGFLPLKKVYDFNPIPKELSAAQQQYVLGAQANVWTEYMATPQKVDYMIFPRILAMSEVLWTGTAHKNYSDFLVRVENFQKRLKAKNIHYANHLYEIDGDLKKRYGQLQYVLTTALKNKTIRYTVNGSEPTIHSEMYTHPIPVNKSFTLKAAVFSETEKLGSVFTQQLNYHLAVGKKIDLSVAPNAAYNAGGKQALINSVLGSTTRYGDKEWLGFAGDDVTITIDLGKKTNIKNIKMRFFNAKGSWIYAPKQVDFVFDTATETQQINSDDLLVNVKVSKKISTQFIRIKLTNYGVIPDGKQGAGNKSWLFVDEIVVE